MRVAGAQWVSRAWAAMVAGLAAIFSLPIFGLVHFRFLGHDLDPSWMAALVEQTARGASQGRDVIFTGGPLSIVFSRYFHPDLAVIAVFASLLVFLLFVYSTYMIVRHAPMPWLGVLLLAPLLLPAPPPDAYFFAVPVLFLAARLLAPPAARPVSSVLFVLASAVLVAAKFSVIPLVVLVAILLDVQGLMRRRFLPHLLAFFLALFLIHVGTGSRAADFLLYLQMSLDTSSHYADAMSLTGNGLRLTLFLAGAITFAMVLGLSFLRQVRQRGEAFRATALALGLAGFLFLSFKAGFVRFDMHELAGWTGLVWVSALFLVFYPPVFVAPEARRLSRLAVVPLLVGVVGMVLALIADRQPVPRLWARAVLAWEEAAYTLRAAADPRTWWEEMQRGRAESIAAIRKTYPLPEFEGTVDIIASRQAMLIANGSAFHFRPTVQEYTTYSPKTLAANRAFFEGPNAPENLLLAPGSIDRRFPTLAEGPLWSLFFSRYEVKGSAGGQVWMVKRKTPLPDLLGPPQGATLDFGVPLPITQAGPLFIEMDIRKTGLGSAASIVFRPPILTLMVTLSDGRRIPTRIVPAIAQGGFLLSPYVETVNDLKLLLHSPEARATLPSVTSIELVDGPLQMFFYKPEVAVRLRPLEVPFAPDHSLRVSLTLAHLAKDPSLNLPRLNVTGEGLYAHAPSSVPVPVTGQTLDLAFGFRPGAYQQGGATDGACFRVLPEGSDTPLFERCLKPVSVPADQGEQKAEVRIPDGIKTVRLVTDCAANCNYDWTLWSWVDFR